jgi:hypothetical protein
MADKIIHLEKGEGPFQALLQRVMRMVPDRDRGDPNLQRLIAFRLKVDGEAATSEYLIRKVRETIQCAYHGSLYDFLKDDAESRTCSNEEGPTDPPEIA